MPRKTVAEWAAQKCGYQGRVVLTPRDQESCENLDTRHDKAGLGKYCEWNDKCVVKRGVNPDTGLSFAQDLVNRADGGSIKRKKAKRKSKSKLFKTKGRKNNRRTRNNKKRTNRRKTRNNKKRTNRKR